MKVFSRKCPHEGILRADPKTDSPIGPLSDRRHFGRCGRWPIGLTGSEAGAGQRPKAKGRRVGGSKTTIYQVPQVVPFYPLLGEGDYRTNGTLILTSLLEDLV